jgi:MFS family permease
MRPPAYDRGSFQAEIWKSRVRRLVRVARVVRDLMRSFWFVAFGVIVGGILGALIGAIWDTSFSFWAGMILGAVLGGAGGGAWAKRLFFSEAEREVEPTPFEPTPGAPRWPGVGEQFEKILFRLRVLFVLLIAPFLLLCYLRVADDYHWPVPSSLPRTVLTWGSVGLIVVVGLLMMLIIRCPKCGRILWKAAQLYEQ